MPVVTGLQIHVKECVLINLLDFLLASGDYCHLLITFANGLDLDQDRHNVGPNLDPNSLTL